MVSRLQNSAVKMNFRNSYGSNEDSPIGESLQRLRSKLKKVSLEASALERFDIEAIRSTGRHGPSSLTWKVSSLENPT